MLRCYAVHVAPTRDFGGQLQNMPVRKLILRVVLAVLLVSRPSVPQHYCLGRLYSSELLAVSRQKILFAGEPLVIWNAPGSAFGLSLGFVLCGVSLIEKKSCLDSPVDVILMKILRR